MITQKFHSTLIVALVLFLSGCQSAEEENKEVHDEAVEEEHYSPAEDTLFVLSSGGKQIETFIVRSKVKRIGTILALPGWNYPYNHWCDSTSLCERASAKGYDIVMPSMEKTIYSDSIYEQTRSDWKNEITRTWINEFMIPTLQQKYNVLQFSEQNKIVGISTGGRGAVLLAMDNPDLFDAGASLSGDFEMSSFPNDNLYRGFFGTYDNCQDVWEGLENPISRIDDLKVPFYIVHGADDQIVPSRHADIFYNHLDSNVHRLNVVKGQGHDYQLWRREISNVLKHFENRSY